MEEPSLSGHQFTTNGGETPSFGCEACFLTHYIEKACTGTLDVIAGCREAKLPEPQFEQRGDQFGVTMWRDWLTDAVLDSLELHDGALENIRSYFGAYIRAEPKGSGIVA